MSYILDALKRSEQDRHQEKVATIGNDMMVLPRNTDRQPLWPYLLVIVLVINAAVFLYLSMKDNTSERIVDQPLTQSPSEMLSEHALSSPSATVTKPLPSHLTEAVPVKKPMLVPPLAKRESKPSVQTKAMATEVTAQGEEIIRPKTGVQRISPAEFKGNTSQPAPIQLPGAHEPARQGLSAQPNTQVGNSVLSVRPQQVPLLSEKSLSFQRQIPAIKFNSHIYSTEASARRAMLNNLYLREGDGFSGLLIKEIGEYYLTLELQGEAFRIPVLRDWQTP